MEKDLWKKLIGEFFGSWLVGFLGLTAVVVAVVLGGIDLFQLGITFALAIAFAVYVVGGVSGAHLNPAVTLAFAIFGGFPKKNVVPYWIAQILGWGVGALFLYLIAGGMITSYEAANGIVRGMPGSEVTAMIFNCYAPHPLFASAFKWGPDVMPTWLAIINEMFGTMMLVLVVFALTDESNPFRPSAPFTALLIGLTVGFIVIICSGATMSGINPARDLGPRIAAWLLGWGQVAFPGLPSGQGGPWYIWTVGPLLGGVLGGGLWKYAVLPFIPKVAKSETVE